MLKVEWVLRLVEYGYWWKSSLTTRNWNPKCYERCRLSNAILFFWIQPTTCQLSNVVMLEVLDLWWRINAWLDDIGSVLWLSKWGWCEERTDWDDGQEYFEDMDEWTPFIFLHGSHSEKKVNEAEIVLEHILDERKSSIPIGISKRAHAASIDWRTTRLCSHDQSKPIYFR